MTGAILEPTGVVPVAGLVVGIGGAALLTGGTIWARSTIRFKRLLDRVTEAVAEVVHSPQTRDA